MDLFLTYLFTSVPMLLVKAGAIILLLLHLLFSIVIIRQTKLMLKVVEAQISPTIYAISLIHLGVSFFVLAFAVLFL